MLPRETNICRRSHGLGDQGDRAAGGEAPDRPRTYTVWLIVLGLNGLYHSFVAVQSLSLSFLAWTALSLASALGDMEAPRLVSIFDRAHLPTV